MLTSDLDQGATPVAAATGHQQSPTCVTGCMPVHSFVAARRKPPWTQEQSTGTVQPRRIRKMPSVGAAAATTLDSKSAPPVFAFCARQP